VGLLCCWATGSEGLRGWVMSMPGNESYVGLEGSGVGRYMVPGLVGAQ
jgi:hypothetical protein